MGLAKRSRPLMIDSHVASSFIHDEPSLADDPNEDDEFIINTADDEPLGQNTNEKFLIEEAFSPSPTPPPPSTSSSTKSNNFNFVNETEIETINNAKHKSNSNDIIQVFNGGKQSSGEPLIKRLKTRNIEFPKLSTVSFQKITRNPNVHATKSVSIQAAMLNNTNKNNQVNQEIVAENTYALLSSALEHGNEAHSSAASTPHRASNSPVVTLPASPNLNTSSSSNSLIMLNENTNTINNNNNK